MSSLRTTSFSHRARPHGRGRTALARGWGLAGVLAALAAAACGPPGVILTIDADEATRGRLDAYCVSLGAADQRRFGRRYALAEFPLPQTLGVRSDGRPALHARVEGLRGGLPFVSHQASFELPTEGSPRSASVALNGCAQSGAPLEASSLVRRASLSFAAESLAVVRTGAESDGEAQLIALSTQAGLSARFTGTGGQLADQLSFARTLPAAGAPLLQLFAHDVDADCGDDLVLVAEGRSPVVWRSDTTGVLSEERVRVPSISTARGAALGDVDRDGYADLVTVGVDGAAVLLSDREGAYLERVSAFDVQPTDARAVALGDLDGDHRLDAVVGFSSGPLRWWRDDGTRSLALDPRPLAGSFQATQILLRDLDSDGDLDVIVASRNAQPGLRLLFNDGHGDFSDRSLTLVPGDVEKDVLGFLLMDVDGDCLDELIVLGALRPPRLFGLDSSGFLDDRGSIGAVAAKAAAAGDLDGDGVPELLLAGSTEVVAWSRPLGGAR